MSRPAIQVRELSKRYTLGERVVGVSVADALGALGRRRNPRRADEFEALRGVSFDVAEGEVVGIIGRNGAGKSTLLKILARITAPSAGLARVRGRVGALLEVGTAFHPELTGRENVYINGALLGMGKSDIRARFDDIVEFAGVQPFLDTPLKRYSSGMHMRLAFAVAAHVEPEIVVVDEVLAVGDAEFQRRCLGRMSQLGREGRTVIFVSHDVGAITQLCSKAIWLQSGAVRAEGPARGVVEAYLHATVPTAVRREVVDHDALAPAYLAEVELIGDRSEPVEVPVRGEPLGVRVVIEVPERVPGLEIALWIRNAQGERVLDEALFDDAARSDWLADMGRTEIELALPPLLPAGEYTLGAWLGSSVHGAISDEEVLRFSVASRPEDRAEMAGRRRATSPVARWRRVPPGAGP